jgi:IS5 family transposase
MNQVSFGNTEYASKHRQTRREALPKKMEKGVPWKWPLDLMETAYPIAG